MTGGIFYAFLCTVLMVGIVFFFTELVKDL